MSGQESWTISNRWLEPAAVRDTLCGFHRFVNVQIGHVQIGQQVQVGDRKLATQAMNGAGGNTVQMVKNRMSDIGTRSVRYRDSRLAMAPSACAAPAPAAQGTVVRISCQGAMVASAGA